MDKIKENKRQRSWDNSFKTEGIQGKKGGGKGITILQMANNLNYFIKIERGDTERESEEEGGREGGRRWGEGGKGREKVAEQNAKAIYNENNQIFWRWRDRKKSVCMCARN